MLRWAALAVAGALAGCAPEAGERIVLQPQAGPPAGIDGTYRGTARLIRAANAGCPRSGSRVYRVENGQVTLSYGSSRRRVPLTASIGGDGRFSASDGVGTMEGTLQNGRLEVSIADSVCEHRWTLTRAG